MAISPMQSLATGPLPNRGASARDGASEIAVRRHDAPGISRVRPSRKDIAIVDIAIDLASAALLLDVDGTLIDLAPHPDAVVVPAALPGYLSTLSAATEGALALVSGRSVAGLDALFAPLLLPLIGSHGAQVRLDPKAPAVCVPALDASLAAALQRIAATMPGVLAEDKRTALALHFRACPHSGPELMDRVAQAIAGRDGVEMLPGHFVIEVKPRGIDKGTAVRAAMARPPFAGRRPVFIGDDVTDEFAFHAVAALGGTAIAVGRPRPGAHHVLPDPSGVRALLAGLAAEAGQVHRRRD